MSLDLELNFRSVEEFYYESKNIESTGNPGEFYRQIRDSDEDWKGLSVDDAEKYKYRYPVTVEKLNLDDDLFVGGTQISRKWSDIDGDDLSMDRMYDGFPPLSLIRKITGDKKGRFVTIHVNIAEPAFVGAKHMTNKAKTVIQLIDYFEEQGMRIEVIGYLNIANMGTYKHEDINTFHCSFVIKRFEDVMNRPLIYTTISPWMFRHHVFNLFNAKFQMGWGYGRPIDDDNVDDMENIYIHTGHCLDEHASKDFYINLLKTYK